MTFMTTLSFPSNEERHTSDPVKEEYIVSHSTWGSRGKIRKGKVSLTAHNGFKDSRDKSEHKEKMRTGGHCYDPALLHFHAQT